ncbi:bleomycin resistance protein [Vibrio rarus]|uniref:bleomycin resistance protein n=1 Tax=Vibrio rarus TaxID=413403 RepID=UPI0021C3DDA2|nr:VOC family protein [Vibrio rarus]
MTLRVVPELYCFDVEVSKRFFINVLRFCVKYQRPQDKFVFLSRQGVDLMLEQIDSNSRKWISGEMQFPLGRGMNLQWDVDDIDALYHHVTLTEPNCIYLAIEDKPYQCGTKRITQRQFIIQSPDGYLFRFCQDHM